MGGGSKTTTTTKVEQTPEEKEFTRQQIELAKQQLKLVEEQHGWNSEIYALTKPLLEKYGLMVEQQFSEYNSPEAADLRERQRQLESASLDAQIRNLPIQERLLQLQLDEIERGGRATPEQKALIGEIANRAIETGDVDISRFLNQGLDTVREDLAPARGLRPTDSPMLDAGGRVLEEALRQKGQLTSQVRGAQANAELNFPLNASQVFGQQNQWQQNFNANMQQFLMGLRQNADQNRTQLMSQLFTAPLSAGEQGISLINAARPSPVSFPRNTTETTKTSGGSILGGIGGLLSGIGSVAGAFSSRKLKEDIKPIEAPPGHVLSPGALKSHFKPVTSTRAFLTRETSANRNADPLFRHQDGEGRRFLFAKGAGDAAATPATSGTNGVTPTGKPPGPDLVKDPVTWGEGATNTKAGPEYQIQPGQGLGFAAPPQTDEDALDRIANLPVSQWRYKPETGLGTDQHIGPMAEDFNTQVMGKGPQPTISVVDSLGALTSAVKALERRTRQGIEARSIKSNWRLNNELPRRLAYGGR